MTMLLIPLMLQAAMAGPVGATAGAEPGCASTPSALAPEWATWRGSAATLTAARTAEAGAVMMTVGQATELALAPTADVRFAATPERAAAAGSHGGMARLHVARTGTYRLAAGSAAWLDIVRDGAALESVGHGHGPACSGMRKIVDFRLEAGDYLVQIAGSAAPGIRLLLIPAPPAR